MKNGYGFCPFMRIIQKNDRFIDPPFNVKEAAIPCAIFSYLVHIIRDFQKDQFNNLNYFADDRIIKIRPLMEPRYQLSLEIIFDLYLMVFERINVDKGSFTSLELNPTPEETRKRVYENIIKFRP